jgi:uncharacterized protein YndB with AHSA1/START domain
MGGGVTNMADRGRFLGTFPDRHTVRFDLWYPHPPEAVWAAITEADQLAAWFLEVTIEAPAGGRVRLREAEGVVTAYEPPSLLEYEFTDGAAGWPDSVLRFELAAHDGGCRLVFSQRLASHITWGGDSRGGPGTMPPGASAGWQGLLQDGLARVLAGQQPPIYTEADKALDAQREERCRQVLEALANP